MVTAYLEPRPSPLAKIERAKRHLRDFESEVQKFYASKPYAVHVEDKNGQRVYRAKKLADTPIELSMIAGDAIHNARSALDHMVAEFVRQGGGNIERASLPVRQDSIGIKGKIADKSPKASARARKFLFRLKPYKAGNSTLWQLHTLDLADKHRLIIPVGTTYAKTRLTPKIGATQDGKIYGLNISQKTSRFVEDGDVILTMPLIPEIDRYIDVKITFDVRFRDTTGTYNEEATITANRLVSYVDKIIGIAERRLF